MTNSIFRYKLQQLLCTGRRRYAARKNFSRRDRLAVKLCVSVVPGANYRTLQGNTGKKPLASTVSVHNRTHGHATLEVTSHWTRRQAQSAPEGDVAPFRECNDGIRSVEDNHKLRDLHSGLKAKPHPSRTDCRGTAPTLVGARNDNAAPPSATEDESAFREGKDRQPFGITHDHIRNC